MKRKCSMDVDCVVKQDFVISIDLLPTGCKFFDSRFSILRSRIVRVGKTKHSLSAGFEPAREDPNGFLVHRLNHSATTTAEKSYLAMFQ